MLRIISFFIIYFLNCIVLLPQVTNITLDENVEFVQTVNSNEQQIICLVELKQSLVSFCNQSLNYYDKLNGEIDSIVPVDYQFNSCVNLFKSGQKESGFFIFGREKNLEGSVLLNYENSKIEVKKFNSTNFDFTSSFFDISFFSSDSIDQCNYINKDLSYNIRNYTFTVSNDSLIRKLRFEFNTLPHFGKSFGILSNYDFITNYCFYYKIFEEHENDTLNGVHFLRFNKKTNVIDTNYIDLDNKFIPIKKISTDNKSFIVCEYKKRTSLGFNLPNKKLAILEYDFNSNSILKVNYVDFKYNKYLSDAVYNKAQNEIALVGYAQDNPNDLGAFSDYWIAILDMEMNIITEEINNESEKKENIEFISKINFDNNGYIIEKKESNLNGSSTTIKLSYIPYELLSINKKELNDKSIEVYPNPTYDLIKVKNNIFNDKIFIYNSQGELIKSVISNSIDLTNDPAGIYFVKIGKQIKKVIKQ